MSSEERPSACFKWAASHPIVPAKLNDGTDKDQKFFHMIRVPMLGDKVDEDPEKESEFNINSVQTFYNKWSFDNMFSYQDHRFLIPTMFANCDAWMQEWEWKRDQYTEPTKAWLGRYCIWYTGESAFYLCKQDRREFGEKGPALYRNVPVPGEKEEKWFKKEMERIWQSLQPNFPLIANEPYKEEDCSSMDPECNQQ